MKLTKSELKEIITEELTTLNEKVDTDKFHKASLETNKLHSNISMRRDDIFDAVLAGLILEKGLNGAKKWVKETCDTYKEVYY